MKVSERIQRMKESSTLAVAARAAALKKEGADVVASDVRSSRQSPPWTEEGPLLRFQIGLEDPRDLITDLAAAFAAAEG